MTDKRLNTMSNDALENELPEGFFSNPEQIVISDEAFDNLTEILESKAGPSPALVALMKRPKPWAKTEA
jgi:hypothetical protein